MYDNLMLTDLDFFQSEMELFRDELQEGSLMDRRQQKDLIKKDPIEELGEVYIEVQLIEQDFKKATDMC